MLRLYNTSGLPEYPLTDIENFHITHGNGGLDTVNFDISPKHPLYSKIAEEIKVDYGDNDYLIKSINRRRTLSTITCELDLDFLKAIFYKNYYSGSKTIVKILTSILPGWGITNQSLATISRTIELEGVTNYDIFWECQNVYGLVYEINKKHKTVKLINPEDTLNYGAYFTDELNLTQLEFKGSTTDYVTRLYPYGKDDLTIASVNGGLEYVQNLSYTNKVISAYWKDDRYTVAQNLKDDAIKKLSELAYPVRSYNCTVLDLAKVSTEYDFLTIRMYDRVTLIDRESQLRVEHKIVEYKEYPDEPDKNVITLSTVPKKIQTSIKSVSAQIEKANQVGGFMQQAIKNATALITGQIGGYVVLDPAEKPERILIMDTPDKETATNVWQWNVNGLGYSSSGIDGPYGLAITMDGKIVADYITSGILTTILMQSDNYVAGSKGLKINLNNGTIDSKNLKVDVNGNMDLAGKISSSSGVIGGWKIESNGLRHTSSETFGPFTQADQDKVQQFVLGTATPTTADYQKYDINRNGIFDSIDLASIQAMRTGAKSYTRNYEILINSQNANTMIETTVTDSVDGTVLGTNKFGANSFNTSYLIAKQAFVEFGANGSFQTADGKNVVVKGGIVTSII